MAPVLCFIWSPRHSQGLLLRSSSFAAKSSVGRQEGALQKQEPPKYIHIPTWTLLENDSKLGQCRRRGLPIHSSGL